MITFIHGDNQGQSRSRLSELIEESRNKEIVRLRDISLTSVKQALESSSLFTEERVVVLENLLASRGTKDIWEYLKKGNYSCDLILWEGKKIDARKLGWVKKVGKVEEFSYPKTLFSFLESVGVVGTKQILLLFNETVSQVPVELLYFMIVRQFRIMLLVANNAQDTNIKETARLQSWMLGKIKSQISAIGKKRISTLNKQLLYIDYQQKSGQSTLNLRQTLDIWLAQV